MSFAGLKKQFNKANQYMSEKIGGAKGTEHDEEFIEMERKTDVMGKLVDDLIGKTEEFLQPNPASRAKLRTVNTISKMRGQAKTAAYPQPEGTLGEHMCKHGKDLGDDSTFGECLVEAGESFKQLADYKYSLEDTVKQNFLEPLSHLQSKDIKEVNHHRKKLSGRRLDYDCKKRKKDKGGEETTSRGAGSNVTDEDIRIAEEKFEESKELTETAMTNLLENDIEHISQLQSFIEAQAEYHRSAMETLQCLVQTLDDKRESAGSRTRRERKSRPVSHRRSSSPDHLYEAAPNDFMNNGSINYNSSNYNSAPKSDACCEAVYDFEPENEGELGFQEGDRIKLISQIDENWYEGSVNGRTGFFPVNYVKVIVDLPH